MAVLGKEENILDFEDRDFPIAIMDTEHHGKVWLHSHSFFEIVYIDKGFSMHSCNDETTILTSGDLFTIRPGEVHAYISAHHTYLYNCLFYMEALDGFSSEIVKLPGMSQILGERQSKWEKLHLDFAERREVLLCLEKMKWEQVNRGIGWELNMKSLLVSFLVLYSRLYSNHYSGTNVNNKVYLPHIYNALKFMEENYQRDFLMKEMASMVKLSPDYISRQFKNAVGLSPVEYLRNYRIAKAMEKLKTTNMPVAEIARSAGFGDISNFSRQFKQVVGVSPTVFRKNEEN
ncbi:MAG: helix-turn-helix transcriptional regulator [Firmicutes bacterium]|nr:helix-turn-helix transcriptional regulator [Bacillota bacterium]